MELCLILETQLTFIPLCESWLSSQRPTPLSSNSHVQMDSPSPPLGAHRLPAAHRLNQAQ